MHAQATVAHYKGRRLAEGGRETPGRKRQRRWPSASICAPSDEVVQILGSESGGEKLWYTGNVLALPLRRDWLPFALLFGSPVDYVTGPLPPTNLFSSRAWGFSSMIPCNHPAKKKRRMQSYDRPCGPARLDVSRQYPIVIHLLCAASATVHP